mmetsp:Transcript_101331/g.246411  ORF Transcript_101331/g.246411 Transcript_101331/m.246411 type:complete len:201 (-) Transcript_101331:465-1067(-)
MLQGELSERHSENDPGEGLSTASLHKLSRDNTTCEPGLMPLRGGVGIDSRAASMSDSVGDGSRAACRACRGVCGKAGVDGELQPEELRGGHSAAEAPLRSSSQQRVAWRPARGAGIGSRTSRSSIHAELEGMDLSTLGSGLDGPTDSSAAKRALRVGPLDEARARTGESTIAPKGKGGASGHCSAQASAPRRIQLPPTPL